MRRVEYRAQLQAIIIAVHSVFIAIAILGATMYFVRLISPPAKPNIAVDGRLSQSAMLYRMRMLGKSCKITERRYCMRWRVVNAKNILDFAKEHTDSEICGDFCNAINRSGAVISSMFRDGKLAVERAFVLGLVKGYPRLYLFCNAFIECVCGSISRESLDKALAAFCESAPLTANEKQLLPLYLNLSLYELLCAAFEKVSRSQSDYNDGMSDGKMGAVDLNGTTNIDYVCGLLFAASGDSYRKIKSLLENNDINIIEVQQSAYTHSAKMYAIVKSVLRSTMVVSNYRQNYNEVERLRDCPIYCECSDDDLRSQKASNFGGETQYKSIEFGNRLSAVNVDNRGGVYIVRKADNSRCKLDLTIAVENDAINLSECDGFFQKDRCVYFYISENFEMRVEIIPHSDLAAVFAKISMLNRSASSITFAVSGAATPIISPSDDIVFTDCGEVIVAESKSGAIALTLGDCVEYGDGIIPVPIKRESHDDKLKSAIAICELIVPPFAERQKLLGLIVGKTSADVRGISDYVSDESYYDCCKDFSRVYNGRLNDFGLPVCRDSKGELMPHRVVKCNNVPLPMTVVLPQIDYAVTLGRGGITKDCAYGTLCTSSYGNLAVDLREYVSQHIVFVSPKSPTQSCSRHLCRESYGECVTDITQKNDITITDGNIAAVVTTLGVENIFPTYADGSTRDTARGIIQAFIVLQDNGVLWSPTAMPCGKGEMSAELGLWVAKYKCAYNGALAELKVFAANGAVFFELRITNRCDNVREMGVMLSLPCAVDSVANPCDDTAGGELVRRFRRCGYDISSSLPITECSPYVESYFEYGKIIGASGLRSGGCTPAPTVCVKLKIAAGESGRAVFCVAKAHVPITLSYVDEVYSTLERMFERLCKITMHTGDPELDIGYKRAISNAYICGYLLRRKLPLRDYTFVLRAIKYVDIKAVRCEIEKILETQNVDGTFDNSANGIYVAYAVMDYVEFAGDRLFLTEYSGFKSGRKKPHDSRRSATVIEHCLLAIEAYNNSADVDRVYSAYDYALLVSLLHYFGRYYADANKYVKLLARAAERFAIYAKRLRYCSLGDFANAAEALVCADSMYRLGEVAKGYTLLKNNNPIARCRTSGKYVESDCVADAIYFAVVTERLLGLKFCGKKVRFNPQLSGDLCNIVIDLSCEQCDKRVVIDGTRKQGNWRVKIDNVNYACSYIDLQDASSGEIVLFRDGRE